MQSEEIKRELKEIAEILNQFKSEAVQLKVLDILTGNMSLQETFTRKPERKSSARSAKEKRLPSERSAKPPSAKPASRSSGHGAHSVIIRLLDEGFFNKAETISAITKHASERLGHRLKANECSPTLLRLLRSGRLSRSKNSDAQYEYKKT